LLPAFFKEKDMKQTLNNQAKRSALALAAVGAFAAFGTVLAAPPAAGPTFAKAMITIAPRTSEAAETTAGDLNCSFTETGVGPYALVSYECKAAAVGVVEACVYKNKIISATQLSVFTNVSNVEAGHEAQVFLAKANGTITGSVITAIPEGGEGGGETHLCPELGEVNGPEPTQEVVAVRWCNASLTDTTNNILGTTVGELFQEFIPGAVTVPSCAELLATPAP
jgi:hypothetical protein